MYMHVDRKIKVFLSILFIISSSRLIAQETSCNDGIDNDGDGFIDCVDGDCQFTPDIENGCNCSDGIDNDLNGDTDANDASCASFYGLTFIGEDSDCSVPLDPAIDFFDFVDVGVVSGQNTVDTQSKITVGDINGDGVPDVVVASKFGKKIRVVDPNTGDVISSHSAITNSKHLFELEIAIGDIDRDGTGEILAIQRRFSSASDITPLEYFIVGYTFAPTTLIEDYVISMGPDGTRRPGLIGLADFDGDGLVELYFRNEIRAAENGNLLATGGGDWLIEVNQGPVAADIFLGGNLELVSGEKIYSVPNLSDRNPVTPIDLSIMVAVDMNDVIDGLGLDPQERYFPKTMFDPTEYGDDNFSSTSVADFDKDGNLDVFLSGARGSNSGNTAIYYWNVADGTIDYFEPTDPLYPSSGPGVAGSGGGWPWGTGRINLGDVEGNTTTLSESRLNANFIAGTRLYSLREDPNNPGQLDWTPGWGGTPRIINDSKSGILALSVFDFDNDGSPEIVYRDSQSIYVIDGPTGTVTYWSQPCQSHTMTEGPVIADVNNDGNTDIAIPCFRGPGAFDINGPIQQQALGEMRLYFSSTNSWLPTRKVWNQHGYHVVNVNDDLTIPSTQFNPATVFGTTACDNGVPGPITPLNMFMNQVPFITESGCPTFPAADIGFFGDDPNLDPSDPDYVDPSDPNYFPAVSVIPPVCGDTDAEIAVDFNIINNGSRIITADVPVTFWNGDPFEDPVPSPDSANLLHIEMLSIIDFQIGDTLIFSSTHPQADGPAVTFNSSGEAFRLFVVLNNSSTNNDLPIILDDPEFVECDIANNSYFFDISPEPINVQIEKISENIKCENTAPNTGELRAVILEGGVETIDYSKFAFQWYLGSDTTTAITDPEGTTNRLTSRVEGAYTLVVTNTDKGCSSLPIDSTIVRIGQDPTINIIENSPQSQCNPFNGELEAFIDGGNTGFTFEWFDNLLNPIGVTGSVASNLAAGEYSVVVSKAGCTKLQSFTLAGPVIPDAFATILTDVFDCNNLSSGSIDADARLSGVLQAEADFTYDWYFWDNDSGTLGSILLEVYGTGKTRTGVPPGFYAVIVTQNSTQCISSLPVVVEVLDLRVPPAATVIQLTPNTSCDPSTYDGSLQASATTPIGEPVTGYTYQWYQGIGTGTPLIGEIAAIVTGLGAGTYTVEVTNNDTNCKQTQQGIVVDNLTFPVVDPLRVVITNRTNCDPAIPNGALGASDPLVVTTATGEPVAGYTFQWWIGGTAGLVPDFTGVNYSSLDIGTYTLITINNDTQCPSAPVQVNIVDAGIIPAITEVFTNNTNCVNPNGAISVSIGGVTAGFNFEWFVGASTTVPFNDPADGTISGVSNEIISGISGLVQYTVRITNTTTLCANTKVLTSTEVLTYPVVDPLRIVITDRTTCDPVALNGVLDATDPTVVSTAGGEPTTGYTFQWWVGNSAIGTADFTGSTYSALSVGTYTLVATNNDTQCSSAAEQLIVADASITPVITLTPTPETTCSGTPNGMISAAADVGGGPVTTGFTFEWFEGSGTGGPVVGTTSGTSDEIAEQLQGGMNYTVRVTDNTSGCVNTTSILLDDLSAIPVITATISQNVICDPTLTDPSVNFTGRIESIVIMDGVPVADFTDYTFTWYAGNSTAAPVIPGETGEILNLVNGGFYTVVVSNTVLGCTSNPLTKEILNNTVLPVITIEYVQQSSCDPLNPNAQLTALALTGGGPSINGYVFEWFVGIGTGTPFPGGNPGSVTGINAETITGIPAGDYTVRITDNTSGCQNTQIYIVNDNIILPVVTFAPATPNTICDSTLSIGGQYDGGLTAIVTYNGVPVTATDYQLTWTGPQSKTGAPGDFDFLNITHGTYTVTATRLTTGIGFSCTSNPSNVDVPDNTVLPTASIMVDNQQTSCDPATPNGKITASALTGVFASADGYVFQWFAGSGTSTPFEGTTSGASGETAESLASNTYTVLITDNTSGCQNTASIVVPDNINIPVVTLNNMVQNTICDDTDPLLDFDGSLEVDVTFGGVPIMALDPGYEYDWYDGEVGSLVFNRTIVANNVIDMLPAGKYTVIVRNTALSCISNPVTFEVTDNITLPTITLADTDQTSCNPGLLNGEIRASALTGGILSPVGYTFDWFVGIDTSTPFVDGADGVIAGVDGEIISGIGPLTYTVLVTDDATGCTFQESLILNEVIEVPIVILAVTTPISTCNPLNGVITPTITSANPAPLGHQFDWYRGQNTLGPIYATTFDLLPAISELSTANTGIPIYSDFYTIVATDLDANCVSNPVTIFLDRPPALFTIMSNVNFMSTLCNDDSGILTAWVDLDADANPSPAETDYINYSFEWYMGAPTDPNANYFTDPVPVFNPNTALDVDQNSIYPGSIPGAAGADNIDYFGPDSQFNGATLFGSVGGVYTVVVTDLSSGCKEFVSIQLTINGAQAQSIVAFKDSEICPLSIGDGTIEVETDPATLAGLAQTDFTHFIIPGTNVGNPGLGLDSLNTTAFPSAPPYIFSSLAPGVYTLVSKNKITGCFSIPISQLIDSAAREPVIIPTIANNTNCTTGNGSISIVAASGVGDTAPLSGMSYSYLWTSANPIIPGEETTANLSTLLPGDYTVTATDDNTNCSITETYTVLDQPYVPVLSAITVVQNNTGCNAQVDGELKITNSDIVLRNGVGADIPGDVTDFEFDVYLNGSDPSDLVLSNVTTVLPATEISFAGLESGNYFVVARRISPGPGFDCFSAPVEADEVLDLHIDPVLTSTATDNTDCDPLDPDGLLQVTADAGGPLPGAYIFEWFTGSDMSTPFNNTPVSLGGDGTIASAGANIEEIQDVLHGQYTVKITNPKGCITIATYDVEYQPEIPEILTFITTDQDMCAPNQNGIIAISGLTIGVVGDYDYTWYQGLSNLNTNTFIAGELLPTISNLESGVYYVIATKKGGTTGSGCQTPPLSIEIMDNTVTPDITFTPTANTNCSTIIFDGTLNAVVLTGGDPIGYTFEWFVGNGTTTPFVDPADGSLVILGGNIEEIRNIAPGDYTLRITDINSCQLVETFTLPDLPEIPAVVVDPMNIQPQEVCFNSGSITITDADLLPLPDVTQYNFRWSRGSDFSTAPVVFQEAGGADNGHILDITTYPSIGADIYWLVVTKLVGPGAECPATPVQIIIEDLSVDPTIAITPTVNTACNLAFMDGSLTVNVSDASGVGMGATYDFNWLQFPVGSNPGNQIGAAAGDHTFNNLGPGTYELQATNNVTLCINSLLVEIEDRPANPIVQQPGITISPQINCNFDGSIEISEVLINGNPEPLNEFFFKWFRGTDFTTADSASVYGPVLGGAANGQTLDITTYGSISADTYWLLVTRIDAATPGSSCQSTPIQLVIEDNTAIPVIVITEPGPQTNCDPLNPNGSLAATADGITAGFTFQWYAGDLTSIGDPLLEVPVANGGNTATIIDVAAGQYALEATNSTTGCSNRSIFSLSENLQLNKPRIQIVDFTNAFDCLVPGTITITSVSNGIANNTYQWFFGSLATTALRADSLDPTTEISAEFLNVSNYPAIIDGTYFVVATDMIFQCVSEPFEVTLTSEQTFPVVSITKGRPDSYCSIPIPPVGNGELLVSADGSNDITQYLFEWFDEDPIANSAAVPFVTNVNTATGLSSTITYYVRATDLVTNCSSVASQAVDSDIELDKPEILSNTKFDPLICNPLTAWMEITAVSTGPVTNHTFEWYRGIDSLNNNNPIPGEVNNQLINVSPGSFFSIAINNTTGCRSLPYEIVIVEDNIILPDINITQPAPQTSCDPQNPDGQLSASADGGITDTDPNYLFVWYSGFSTSGTPIDTASTLSGIPAGPYTVEVINLISGCSAFQSFILEDNTQLAIPQVSPSFEPQTRCDVNNGSLQARVINISGSFSYRWYNGTSVKAVADVTGASLTGMPPGTYTVTATDINTSCVSEPVTIELADERITPLITIVEDQPLINCDPARPNGQLSASVNGIVGPYLFEWYNGTVTLGSPDFIGDTYTNLAMGVYTVVVTDKITLCSYQMQGEITDSRFMPPSPSPEVVNNLTSCLEPNGELQVNVDGETFGFQFDWYLGTGISGTPDFTGAKLQDLDIGSYSVTATNTETGCVSESVTVEIINKRVDPEFEFNIVNSPCETSGGSIEVEFLTTIPIDKIIWTDPTTGQQIAEGSGLYEFPTGNYEVTVTSAEGCSVTKTAQIGPELISYNGISPNGDQNNDGFEIACITLFPNNNVKIFNRAGNLVYEADGYNNDDIIFKGIGENGVYIIGEEVPDGTYFYIIDKRDGSKPERGFLELLR